MTLLEDLFGGPEYSHPKLRLWAAKLDAGLTATVEIHRPWDGIMRQRPEISHRVSLGFGRAGW